ncbi:hypothetical protein [Shewanella marina]|uniref:hypothetical protein n=1 Tax=Shewanella marina TaxID=487319 RepID=UPI001900F7BF|nr:hypothetical protein [Shewanella marina]
MRSYGPVVALAMLGLIWLRHQSSPQTQLTPGQKPDTGTDDFNEALDNWSPNINSNNGVNNMPRGIRNNNPLNIETGDNWQGLIGSDGRFAQFETPFYGIRAAGRTLRTYRIKYGLTNIAQIINRWAPPHENPTDKYIDFVATQAGISANQSLSMADYPRVVAAMIHFENGINPYEQNIINSAVAAGLA